jgi:hypothetical protein
MKLNIGSREPYLSIKDNQDSWNQRASYQCTYNVLFTIGSWTPSLQMVLFITTCLGHNMSLWLACALQSSVLFSDECINCIALCLTCISWYYLYRGILIIKIWFLAYMKLDAIYVESKVLLFSVQLWTNYIIRMFNFFIFDYMDIVSFKILWFWYHVEVGCITNVPEHVSSAFRVEVCWMRLWCQI